MTPERQQPPIVFVNRYYWPDEVATAQLLTDLAEGLAARAWSVKVIASRARGAAVPARERRAGVEIVRLPSTRWGHGTLAGKAMDYLTFSASCRRALRAETVSGGWLVAMTDPPTLALLAGTAARRAPARLVHWIQDIHPEISIALSSNILLPVLAGPWMRRRNAAWREARFCVAVSRDMAESIATHGVCPDRLRVIPNWAPGGILAPAPSAAQSLRQTWGVANRLVVAYSGNLGRVHELESVTAAAALLRAEPDVIFLFIGDGPQRRALEASARAQRLPNVRFLPPQPRERLGGSLSAADLHLVTLRLGCERCVYPSKIYGIAAVGRPAVFVGPPRCSLAETIREFAFGVTVAPGDAAGLATAVRALKDDEPRRTAMGRAARSWAQATGGFSGALAAWEDVLTTE